MKLTLMGLVLATALCWSCGPTTYTSTSDNAAYAVPASVQNNFNAQFPGAAQVNWGPYNSSQVPIDWEMTGWTVLDKDDYSVTYMLDGQRQIAWYDSEGNWIGSSYVVTDPKILPSAVHTMLQQKYPGFTLDKIDKEMWKDQVAYELKLKNGENKLKLLVDANGNVLKEKLKND